MFSPTIEWKKDLVCASAVFLLALLIRLPFIAYPAEVIFDEGLGSSFAAHFATRIPYFDVHPPLVPIINSLIFGNQIPQKVPSAALQIFQPFPDFIPYARMRSLNAAAGSLLAAVIFLLAKVIYKKNSAAFLSAGLIVFDNAFVTYSRFILPDTYLLLFGFLGLLCAVHSGISENKFVKYLWIFFAGVFLGCAASVKWTGLGFAGASFLFLFYKKQKWHAVLAGFLLVLVYAAASIVFFMGLAPQSGAIDRPAMQTCAKNLSIYLDDIRYPSPEFNNALLFIPRQTGNMLGANRCWQETRPANATYPYQWPFGTSILLYMKDKSSLIELRHNPVGLIGALIAFLAALPLIIIKRRELIREQGHPWILFLTAWLLIQYIPLFFISRALFMYHYFATITFGYLLIPAVIPFFAGMLPAYWQKYATLILGYAVFISFLIFAPLTYGTPVDFWSRLI